ACYGIKIDHTERETTGVVGKAERLTWHKAWTMVSTGFSISYTSSPPLTYNNFRYPNCPLEDQFCAAAFNFLRNADMT
ncbi:hypothetical protein, partial [Escherichia coli]|uniref:hypothetical protein n=1 Tax=Escherichia coli TaxID=562 RepID=UPI001CD163CC